VIVAHSQTLVREGLVAALEPSTRFQVVAIVDGEPAEQTLLRQDCDVAILQDAGTGAQAHLLASLCRHGRGPRVVLIAERWSPEAIYRAFREGAAGFLTHRDEPMHVAATVLQVHRQPEPGQARGDTLLRSYLKTAPVAGSDDGSKVEMRRPLLTRRELEVLRYTAQGFSIRETSRLLRMSVPTVKNHRHAIYSKLGVPNAAAAVSRAWSYGYMP
jgi:two-component system nitrate/nitrite response regulator NarL